MNEQEKQQYIRYLRQQSKSIYLKRADRDYYKRLLNEILQSDAKHANAN